MIIRGTDISMVRGDSEDFTISCYINNGSEGGGDPVKREFVQGDTVIMSVASTITGSSVFSKVITSFIDGSAPVSIIPEDTNGLLAGDYIYSVKLKDQTGRIKTFIPKSKFTLEGDVPSE